MTEQHPNRTPSYAGDHATGRVVVVTGAANGMGKLIAERFLNNGDTVIATDIDESNLQLLRQSHADDPLYVLKVDIAEQDDTEALAELARAKTDGRVDILVNCAGWFPIDFFSDMSVDRWRKVVDVNLNGPFLVIKALLPLIKGRGWGRIINIGSASIFNGVPGQSHYVAAKSGLVGMTRSLAMELGVDGITVNVVAPGLTVTAPVLANFPEHMRAQQLAQRAIKRDQQPEDIVEPVFFLASQGSNFMTGQTVTVDGGRHKS